MKGYVVDTSVLYYGKDLPADFEIIISPGVVRELEKDDMADRLQLLMATRVRVHSPSKKSMDRVSEAAAKTGDSRRLSETDKEILAKVGVFYSGILGGCSCADDPTPVEASNEYREVMLTIDKKTAQASASLVEAEEVG